MWGEPESVSLQHPCSVLWSVQMRIIAGFAVCRTRDYNWTHPFWNPTVSPLKFYHWTNLCVCGSHWPHKAQWIWDHDPLTLFWKNRRSPVSSPCCLSEYPPEFLKLMKSPCCLCLSIYPSIPQNFLSLWNHLAVCLFRSICVYPKFV
jgi:hypothetical protein